jgi:hypothetical protein
LTTKQYTKFQSYSYKDDKRKSGKLKKSEILLSSRGITLAKKNQSNRNANWNSNSWLKSNSPSFNPIAAKMAKKSPENWKNLKFSCSRGITLAKMNQSHRNANWNSNSWLQSNTPSFNPIAVKMTKKSPENCKWPRTDGQRHNIIRPVFRRAYKNQVKNFTLPVMLPAKLHGYCIKLNAVI